MKKVFLALLILLLLITAAVVAVPIVFKDKLIEVVNKEASKNLNAKIEIKDFSASILKDFPNITLGLQNFNISGKDKFEGLSLLNGEELSLVINLFGLLQGEKVSIESVGLNRANINVLIDKDGNANYDIAKESTGSADSSSTESDSELTFSLKGWNISESNFSYEDKTMNFSTTLQGIENTGSGDFTLSEFLLSTSSRVDTFTLSYEGIAYLYKTKLNLDADVGIDLDNMFFEFKKNKALINDLELSFSGNIAMPENGDIVMDLSAASEQSQLRNLMSLVPAVFTEDYANIKIEGGFDLEGLLKGVYNDNSFPGFKLGLEVKDGSLQYPDLPSKVDRISLKAKVESAGGEDLDNMLVDVANMHAEIANNPIDFALHLEHPISDPDIDAKFYGKVDLASLKKAIPLDGYTLAGKLNANVTMKGKMSSLEMKDYEKFQATGTAAFSKILVGGSAMESELKLDTAQMSFSPKLIVLNTLKAEINGNALNAKGSLSNYMAYAFKDQELVGNLEIESELLDANAFMEAEEEPAAISTEETASSYIEIPKNIDFTLKSKIDKLLYEDYVIENFSGLVTVKNQELRFNDIKMQSFGGDLKMAGYYQTREETPKVALDFNVEDLDVNRVATKVDAVALLAPLAKNCTGRFDAIFSIEGALDKELNPVWSAYQGNGLVKTKSIFFENFEPINRLASKLNISKLAKQTIEDTKVFFEIKDGRLEIKPVSTKIGDISAKITGSTGFDQTIDYTFNLAIPKSYLGSTASTALAGLSEKLGGSAKGDVDVDVFFTNTVKDPKLRVNIAGVSDVKDQVANKVKQEFNSRKDSLQNALNAKAEEEKERLRKAAEEVKQKAEAERKKKEEELRKKAEEEKKRLEEEAKKKLRGLINKP